MGREAAPSAWGRWVGASLGMGRSRLQFRLSRIYTQGLEISFRNRRAEKFPLLPDLKQFWCSCGWRGREVLVFFWYEDGYPCFGLDEGEGLGWD